MKRQIQQGLAGQYALNQWFGNWSFPLGPNTAREFRIRQSTRGTGQASYGRLVVLAAGTYAIGRGISNVAEGYERFFPNLWPKLRAALTPTQIREWFVEGYHQPRVNLPTKQLKFHIWWLEDQIAALEKKLQAAVKAGRDTALLQKRIGLARKELKITTERYEKEVLGNTLEDTQAK